MMVKRDYNKPVIPTSVVMELLGMPDTASRKANFHTFVKKNGIENLRGTGSIQTLFSISAVRKIALLKRKEVEIPSEYLKICEVEAEPPVVSEVKEKTSSDDWAKKAEMLAWLTGKTVDEILNDCLDSYKRYVARVVNDAGND